MKQVMCCTKFDHLDDLTTRICGPLFSMWRMTVWCDQNKYFINCRPLECLALMVSCACHDLDHRGTTNSFQTQSGTVLANLYSSEGSVMEVKKIYILWRFSYVHHCQFHKSLEVCFADLVRHVSQICCCDTFKNSCS